MSAKRLLTLVGLTALTVVPASAFAAGKPQSDDPVRLAVFNIPDADFITNVLGQVLSKAGYQVEYVKTDYSAHFTALEFGDIDASPAAWSSVKEQIDKALASGEVEKLGEVGVRVKEGLWYPSYVADLCPGLPNWEALTKPDCVKALSTPETAGKINFLGVPADIIGPVETAQALKLDIHVTPPGSLGTMIATMQGDIQKKVPVIGYGFVPHWLYGSDTGSFIELPAFEQACYDDPAWGSNPDATRDCAPPEGSVFKLVNKGFETKEPYATEIMKKLSLNTDEVAAAIKLQEVDGQAADAVASDWVAKNESVWAGWIN
ncbi:MULTISPECIES: ABC transporter substrate-binding protein [Rhizobium]|uniref:ABC transporter n=1 Tax=Rhizobium wuzhouense TaxID=1986026 RepID=A0ABX5NKW3_9HYPH|nr:MULTISPECIES: ABC transporter substrate-binding protein [Rhizobium]PYB69870.1 ABC transporter [Rhizobium wuzhouense]RKE77426.1 glycine betaine/proline transport system substrate-binding protein [Rhizobium sp. AG855]